MTLFSIVSAVCRLAGLVRLADSFWRTHTLRMKSRELANTPTTRPELEETLKDGKL